MFTTPPPSPAPPQDPLLCFPLPLNQRHSRRDPEASRDVTTRRSSAFRSEFDYFCLGCCSALHTDHFAAAFFFLRQRRNGEGEKQKEKKNSTKHTTMPLQAAGSLTSAKQRRCSVQTANHQVSVQEGEGEGEEGHFPLCTSCIITEGRDASVENSSALKSSVAHTPMFAAPPHTHVFHLSFRSAETMRSVTAVSSRRCVRANLLRWNLDDPSTCRKLETEQMKSLSEFYQKII